MSKLETSIQNKIRLAVARLATMFRNNVGLFTTDRGSKVRTGLCKGSSDLIGWTEILVTPSMVGQKIAVFTAIEVKTPTGKVSKDQKNFNDTVRASGGISGVARSPEDAVKIIENYRTNSND